MNIKKKALAWVFWLWMLPQQLLGFFLVKLLHGQKTYVRLTSDITTGIYYKYRITIYKVPRLFHSAVSLGTFLIFDSRVCFSENSIKHENGHTKQSFRLGWLYLPIVGIPSLAGNIYSRIFHKTTDWYYSRFPENWANKLGGAER